MNLFAFKNSGQDSSSVLLPWLSSVLSLWVGLLWADGIFSDQSVCVRLMKRESLQSVPEDRWAQSEWSNTLTGFYSAAPPETGETRRDPDCLRPRWRRVPAVQREHLRPGGEQLEVRDVSLNAVSASVLRENRVIYSRLTRTLLLELVQPFLTCLVSLPAACTGSTTCPEPSNRSE